MPASRNVSISPVFSMYQSLVSSRLVSGVILCHELRQCDSLRQFRLRLKTYFFGIWDHVRHFVTLVRQRRIEILLLLSHLMSCLHVSRYVSVSDKCPEYIHVTGFNSSLRLTIILNI